MKSITLRRRHLKKQRLAECGITLEAGVHFVAADLAREQLDAALSKTSFNRAQPTFFSWLGVTMYLTRAANMAALKSIVACSAPGSELVFSYIDQKLFQPEGAAAAALFAELEQTVKSVGEPFVSGFHPADLADDIRHLGLELVEDLNDFQLVERYDPAGVNGLKPARSKSYCPGACAWSERNNEVTCLAPPAVWAVSVLSNACRPAMT